MHSLKCWLWKILWGLALVSLIIGVVELVVSTFTFLFPSLAWFWIGLILGVLATPIKLDCQNCAGCQAK